MKSRFLLPAALLCAVFVYSLINPLRPEHFLMLGAGAGFWFLSRTTRDFAVTFAPFVLFTWIYDLLRIFSDQAVVKVTIEGVHRLELMLFGWTMADGTRLTPNDIMGFLHTDVIDVIGGVWYASHVGVIILLGAFLWWRQQRPGERDAENDQLLNRFMWGFLFLNLGMFTVNVLMPVAPPWYVEQFGYALPTSAISGDPAGLGRIDELFGISYFSSVYGKSSYVFGAMPSGHTAYAVWFALHMRGTTMRLVGWTYALVMAFFAVYLTHHYVLDVLAGTTLAVSVYLIFRSAPFINVPCAANRFMRRIFGLTDPVVADEDMGSV